MLMASRTPNGKDMRMYYIKVEGLARNMKDYFFEYMSNQKDEQIEQERDEKFKILHKYNSKLQKHRFFKFKKIGPCFYVIIQGLEYADGVIRIKIGICGCPKKKMAHCPHCEKELNDNKQSDSFDGRLQNHRTLWPQLQVKFAVYTDDAELLERCIKRVYKKQINPGGHEIIENVEVEELIIEVKKYLDMFNMYNKDAEDLEYIIEENLEEYNKISMTNMKNRLDNIDVDVKEIKYEVNENKENIRAIKYEVKENKDNNDDDVKEMRNEISMMKDEMDENKKEIIKYREYIENLEQYKGVELKDILKKLGLVQSGINDIKRSRIRSYVNNKIEKIKVKEEVEEIKVDEVNEIKVVEVEEIKVVKVEEIKVVEVEEIKVVKVEEIKVEEISQIEVLKLMPMEELLEIVDKISYMDLRQVAKHYDLTQVGTRSELIDRIRDLLENGVKKVHKNSKIVYSYNKDGKMVGKYLSINDAAKRCNISEDIITLCLNKASTKTAGGLVWKYNETMFSKEELKELYKHSKSIGVIQYSKSGEELMRYDSIFAAKNATDVGITVITNSCEGKKTTGEFYWKYDGKKEVNKQLTNEQKKEIKEKYRLGVKVNDLAKEYEKSVKQVRRVVKD
jgi:hypothetical protein